jgi:hypothetical protein
VKQDLRVNTSSIAPRGIYLIAIANIVPKVKELWGVQAGQGLAFNGRVHELWGLQAGQGPAGWPANTSIGGSRESTN